jgi:nucleoside-diphosphate kinase
MIERTCILIKPDAVCKKHAGDVIGRLEKAGLQLLALRMLRVTRAHAEDFYQEHKGKEFYERLIRFMTSAPIVATAWQGENAVAVSRKLIGATDSRQAAPGTIRRDFGTDNRRNVVHGSDSVKSAEREISFFFKPGEILTYNVSDWQDEPVQNLTGKK